MGAFVAAFQPKHALSLAMRLRKGPRSLSATRRCVEILTFRALICR